MKRCLMLACSLVFSVMLFSVLFLSLQSTVEAAPTGPETLLSDDFEDANADGWVVQSGDWAVIPEYSVYRVVFTGTSPTSRRSYIDDSTVPGSSSWTDYVVQAKFNIEGSTADNGFPWIIARWQNSNNYYYLGIEGDGDVRIRKYVGGSSVTLSDVAALGLTKDTWHTGALEVSGSPTPTLRAYINGTLVLTTTDSLTTSAPFLAGPIGLGSSRATVQFDDVLVTDITGTTTLFSDDFEDGAGDWIEQSGYWEIFSNYVYHVDYAGSSPSSRRSYTGDATWTDYVIQARVKVESITTTAGGWGMLMARWQDSNNYYYLSLEADGDLRVRKYVGGSSSTISFITPSLSLDTWYTLALEVSGDTTPTLRAWLDGTPVITTTDASGTSFTAGPIALGSYQGSVQFDDVVVTDLSIFALTVNKTGSGSGTVTSVPEGIDCGVTCTAGFVAGTVVSLTATPEAGDSFVGWLGACSGTGDCVLTMDAAKNVEAVFSDASAPALVVHKDGAGSGTVTSDPAGIDCGDACAVSFATGSTVTLTAAADTGSTFAGWSGACSGADDCVLTMNADTIVTATFVLGPFDLNVTKAGNGDGNVTSDPAGIDCSMSVTCTAQFDAGTVVTLTEVADVDSIFTGWSGGGCSGTGDCVVTILANTDVIATFQSLTQTLTVAKTGNGGGVVTSDPAGIDCGATCAADYPYGTVITLTAVADGDSVFAGWNGAGCSGTDVCVVTLDDTKTVEASFMAQSQTLTVVKTGNGAGVVTSDPAGIDCGATCVADFPHGIPVMLTAVPAEDSLFIGWTGGGCSGNGNCVVTMTASTTVTAAFKFNATLPFTDDFESGLNKWTVQDGDWSEGADDWHYRVVFTGTSPTSRRAYIDDSTVPGSSAWTDYAVQAQFNIEGSTADNGFPWIIARWQNSNNYYYLGIEGDGDVRIRKYVGGSSVTLGDVAALGLAKDTWHTGKLEVTGSTTPTLRAYINGALVLTATDNLTTSAPFLAGPIGLGSSRATVQFDDVLVTDIGGTTTLFDDDFEDGADGWIVQSGVWELVADNIFYHVTYVEGSSPTFSLSYAGAPTWTDYFFQARVRVVAGTYAMLVTRRQDAGNYYLMALRMDNGKIEVKRMQPGGSIGIGSVNAGLVANTWYTAAFEVKGSTLRCYIDGTPMITITDTALAWGEIGVGTMRASADFDDVWVGSLVPTYTLSVARSGSGTGTVTSDPAGLIDCGDTCSVILEHGTVVTLTAIPDAGDSFAGWMGACSGTGDCVLTMDEVKAVTAVFASESSPMLIVYKDGTGDGWVTSVPAGIDCGDTCAASFTDQSAVIPVTLYATPTVGSEFIGWEGAGCSGTDPCLISLDMSKSVTATFTYLAYPLTVVKAGNGSGMVTSEPPGIDCGDTCSATMGGVVTLTAVADARSWFKGWTGEGCTGLGTCELTMDSAKSVTATFVSYPIYLPLVMRGYPPIPVIVDPLYVAPDGDDDDAGTFDAPFATLDKALSVIVAGQTVYMRDGIYTHTQTISLTQLGNFVNMYKIWAYPGELPILDFSGSPAGARGFVITGAYWHLKGLEIQYAQDNAIKIDGSYNIVENCVMHHNQDTGLQIGLGSTSVNPNGSMASYNQIINCDSYRNFDVATNGGNADGFACKLHAGRGNSFTGCRAWENTDDGWDLFDTDYPVTIDNSWTWHNGDKALFGDPVIWGGNGNGFKVGGNYDNAPHILRNCVAFDNAYSSGKGFDQNHNMSGITIYNSVGWGNLYNFAFNETPNDGSHHVLHNNISFSPVITDTNIVVDSIQDHNSWTLSVTAATDDFLSLAETLAKAPRQADGSLPVNDFARLVAGSDLIDVGVDVSLPYCGTAPDLGAFEYCP